MMEIPLKGNIRDFSLPKILVYLNRNKKTGTLIVRTSTFAKNVYLDKGEAIFASSTYEDDRLGEILMKAGKITLEQYERSVEELLKKTGKRQGTILVELGYLTPKDIFWGVKYQVREIINSLFFLEDAEYEFKEGEIPLSEVIVLKISMGNLIYEGVKRIDNLTRIKNEVPNINSVLKLSTDPAGLFQNIELSPQDKDMLSMIDGKKAIKELIDSSPAGSFESLKTLYVLWSTGMVQEEAVMEKAEGGVPVEDVPSPLPEEQRAFMERMDEMYANLDRLSANELLEIDEGSDSETIKKNYYRLSKEFHPDRHFTSPDPMFKNKLTAIFDALTRAYTLLKDDEERRKYFDSLGKVKKEKGLTAAMNAEEQFKRGVREYKKGNFWGAAESFKWAIKLAPENARYWSHLSLSFSKIPNRLKDAEEALLHAIKLEPFNAEHYANLGHIYLKAGMQKRAQGQFEKALKLDPKNVKAEKGLKQTKT